MPAMRISDVKYSLVILGLSLAAVPASAADATERVIVDVPTSAATQKQRIDGLFEQLKRQRDPEQARGIADQLRLEWNESGSATVNLLMQWANQAIGEKRNAAAFDFLDQVTILKPDYVEGWNRRATLYYTLGNPRKSMADINHVLTLEPRHFGALAGMAAILTETGHDALALKAWERFLEVFPADRTAQEQMNTLSEKLAGSRT